MARATAGMLLHWSYVEDCTVVLLRHRGLLRTNEYLTCHLGDFIINKLMKKRHMLLPDSTTSTRHGRSKPVTLTDPEVLLVVSVCRAGKLPGGRMYPCGSTFFRKRFRQVIQALGRGELDIQP